MRQWVQRELTQGERIAWMGCPSPNQLARHGSFERIFALFWLAFVAFWTFVAAKSSPVFACFSIPFWLIGLFMLTQPLRARRNAARTVYVVTDRRAMWITGGKQQLARSFYLDAMGTTTSRVAEDGSGDIVFGSPGEASANTRQASPPGFFGVPDVRALAAVLEQQRQAAREASRR